MFHIGLKINIQYLHYIFYFLPSHIKTNHKNTFKLLPIKKRNSTYQYTYNINNIHVNMIFNDIKSLTNLVSVKLCPTLINLFLLGCHNLGFKIRKQFYDFKIILTHITYVLSLCILNYVCFNVYEHEL